MVGWFEIPVTDMERAKKFYEAVFEIKIEIHQMGVLEMGWFPNAHDKPGASGSLVKHEDAYRPSSTDGVVIYFSCQDLSNELGRVASAGGEVMLGKTEIGDGHGFMALMKDSEGNRIALHSQK